jgi:hypothetical protein
MPAKRTPHLVAQESDTKTGGEQISHENMKKASIPEEDKKNLNLKNFKKFFQKVYFSRALELKDPDGEYNRTEIDEISDFLGRFKTNPPNMKEIFEKRGAEGEGAIVSLSSIAYCSTMLLALDQQILAELEQQMVAEAETKAAKDYAQKKQKNFKPLNETDPSSLANGIEEAREKLYVSIAFNSCIALVSYLQQESTFLKLSIASENIRCTPQYDPTFVDFCTKVEESLKNIEKYYSRDHSRQNEHKAIVKKMFERQPHIDLFTPEEFFSIYNEKCKNMALTHLRLMISANDILAKSDHTEWDYSYQKCIMDKNKFIAICNNLKIWNAEQIVLDTALNAASELFKDHEEKCLKKIDKHRFSQTDSSWASKTSEYLIDCTEKIKISRTVTTPKAEASAVENLHINFARFTPSVLFLFAELQALDNAPKLTAMLHQKCTGASKAVILWGQKYESMKKKSCKKFTSHLEKRWEKISCLAKKVPDYATLNNAELFAKLTNDIETDLGLHEMTRKMFGENSIQEYGKWLTKLTVGGKLKIEPLIPGEETDTALPEEDALESWCSGAVGIDADKVPMEEDDENLDKQTLEVTRTKTTLERLMAASGKIPEEINFFGDQEQELPRTAALAAQAGALELLGEDAGETGV